MFVRYFTCDDEVKYKEVVRLYEKVSEGQIVPYVSSIVLLEVYFVLKSVYGFEKKKCIKAIEGIVGMRNCVVVEKTDTKLAMKYLVETGVKFSDCMIATQVPKNVKLVTYDEEFGKIKAINRMEVKELIDI